MKYVFCSDSVRLRILHYMRISHIGAVRFIQSNSHLKIIAVRRKEEVNGSIEVGKLADLCVLDGDTTMADAREIIEIRVLMTVVGGKVVYDAR